MSETLKHQIVIVGGGSAGITAAARLLNDYPERNFDIAIIEPSESHYYQPLWTLVGGGVFEKEETRRAEADYIPDGTTWIKEKVATFNPEKNEVTLESERIVQYDYLIVSAGIVIDWEKIKGFKEAIETPAVCTNYSYDYVQKTWDNVRNLKSGTAIFTHPLGPLKCAGAPQKITYLAEHYFRRQGVRDKVDVVFAHGGPAIFGVPKYKRALEKVVKRKELTTKFEHNLIEIDGARKVAVFNRATDNTQVEMKYDMLHVSPPHKSPDFIHQSPLADAAGFVDVDKYTLRHVKYPNVFSSGDCSSLPTSKTGAAIRKQIPVLCKNLISQMEGKELQAKYNGYTSCPLVTGYGSLILAEFDYDGNPDESFPFDQAQERFSMYMLKAYALPNLYWHGMLRGKA